MLFVNKKLLITIIFLGFLVVRLIYSPQNFYDYESYSLIANNIPSSIFFEWIFYKKFQLITNLTDNSFEVTNYIYFLNFFIFFLLLYFISKSSDVKKIGILIFIVFFGPLFAFVILRAAPAYLLIFCSLLLIEKNRICSFVCALIAVFYHISAVIPFMVILSIILFPKNNNKIIKKIRFLIYIFGILNLTNYLFDGWLINIHVFKYLSYFDYLSKYEVYDQSELKNSVNHFLYFLLILYLFILIKKYSIYFNKTNYIFINIMILVYMIFLINPIVAFRLSIFFLIPFILVLPWEKIFGFYTIFIYLFSPFILYFSFRSILIQ
jgi:hypothetical protein